MLSWSVWKRFFLEYWPAFTIAVVWAIYRTYPFGPGWIGTLLSNFGGSFFVLSWFSGQFVRIDRQSATEQKLNTLGDQLKTLTGTVVTLTGQVDASPQLKRQLSGLTGTANVQLAQANSTLADVRRSMGSLPWATPWSLPRRAPINMTVHQPAQTDVPKPPVGPTGAHD